jgi:hypothetical protein
MRVINVGRIYRIVERVPEEAGSGKFTTIEYRGEDATGAVRWNETQESAAESGVILALAAHILSTTPPQ